jgi:hypothetical protein
MLFMLNLLLLLVLLSNILTRVTGQTLNTLDNHLVITNYQTCITSPSNCTVLYVPSHPPRKRLRHHHISEATHAIDQRPGRTPNPLHQRAAVLKRTAACRFASQLPPERK